MKEIEIDFSNLIKSKEEKLALEYPVKTIGEISIKDVDISGRVVTGIYNTFNYFDHDFDVLLPGCMSKSINEHGPDSGATRKIKHALNHDLRMLPGKIEKLQETEVDVEGFGKVQAAYFETRMAKTQLGTDTLINYDEKVYDNHSIGFRYLDLEFLDNDSSRWNEILNSVINPEDMEKAGMCWIVKEVELFEGSTVAMGANELTPFLGIKSGNKELQYLKLIEKMSIIEKQLRNGKQSDETLYDLSIELRQIKQMFNEIEDLKDLKRNHSEPGAGGSEKKPVSQMIAEAKFNFV